MRFNGFYRKTIIDELVGMLFESYDEITPDGGLGKDIELQIATAKHCHELYFYICDELQKLGMLPNDMRGYNIDDN